MYNEYIMPAMTYGSETWKLTKSLENKLRNTQISIERTMVMITPSDHHREQTKIKDIIGD